VKAADYVRPDRVLDTFLELVKMDSPSGQEAAIGQHLLAQFRQLGCSVDRDAAGNVFARLSGTGDETILLSSHMDTVGSDTGIKPVVRDGVVYSQGDTILGADDKSGIAVILEALRLLQEHPDWEHPPLEIVLSVSEEKGLLGAKQVDMSQLQADWGVILDAGGPIGSLTYSAPSQTFVDITVHGKKAHAGSSPEKGINAIRVAAEAITAMPLGRIDEETTANIGIIEGGEATNIVPDRVSMQGEARSRNEAKLAAQLQAMTAALETAAAEHGTTVDIELRPAFSSYLITPDQRPYMAASGAIQSLGLTFAPQMGGGGSDGNIYNAAGIPCVPLSTGMADVHTKDEHIAVQDMVDCARVIITLLTETF